VNAAELAEKMLEAKRDCDAAIEEHRRCAVEAAESDRRYRLAKATSILATAGTVQEREARMDKATADDKYAAKLADDLLTSALEAIRNKRQILSAWQSVAAATRAEAELAKWERSETSVA
jgi:hypothetical protein